MGHASFLPIFQMKKKSLKTLEIRRLVIFSYTSLCCSAYKLEDLEKRTFTVLLCLSILVFEMRTY